MSNFGEGLNVDYKWTHVSRLQTAQNVQFFLSDPISVHSITGQTSKAGKRIPPKEYEFWWSQETLGVFRLDK